ncbi:MAG: hypothetical protein WA874_09580 [Chryseosolibacter sp.]
MLKKSILFSLAVLLIVSCDEVDKMLTFRIDGRTTIRVESNASPIALPLEIPTPEVTSNSQQQYENNNTHASLVKDVKLEALRLTITDPSAKTFSFLKTIRIFISADQTSEIELAFAENISSDATTLELTTTKEKLDAYIKASSYNLRTEVITDEALTESVDIQADLKFLVTADTY